MTRNEIIDGLKFTIEMFLLDTNTGETFIEPRNDMDKITVDACKGAIELLEQEPTAEVVERKRGEWVLKDGTPIDHELEMMEEAFCNQCGNSAPGIPFWDCDLDLTNFCPNCGADMRGDDFK